MISFNLMALAINVMDGYGPSNKMRPYSQLKKTKVRLPLILQQKASYELYITNKTEHDPYQKLERLGSFNS